MSAPGPQSRPEFEPAYTVIGFFEGGALQHAIPFAEVFYTYNGPEGAESLARRWAAEQSQGATSEKMTVAAVVAGRAELALAGHGSLALPDDISGRRETTDRIALDRMAALLNEPGQWCGSDVCDALCRALLRTGRYIDSGE